MRPPSLHRALLVRCGLGIGVLLGLLSVGVFLLVRQSLYRELDESISQTAALLANQVELENDELSFEWKEGIGTNTALIEEGFFQFWDESTGVTTRSPGLRQADLPRFTGPGGAPEIRTIALPNGHRARAIGLRALPFVLPEEIIRMRLRGRVIDTATLPQTLIVARDSEPVHRTLDRLRWILAGGAALCLGLGFLLIRHVVRTTLRPLDELDAQVRARTGPQLDAALDLPGRLPVELAGLARNFDALLSRVAAIRERERDFIRHAAHELRTPIAGLCATTDLALSQDRSAAAYAGHLATCQRAAAGLAELVNRLSAIARLGASRSPALRESLDAVEILAACLESFLPAFANRGLSIVRDFPKSAIPITGDRALLRIILNNFLDNAASHAAAGADVRICVSARPGGAVIAISNGTLGEIGDPARLFEPLFQRDPSRSAAGTHLGIGLTLSQEAAAAMGANLTAEMTAPDRIEFRLEI